MDHSFSTIQLCLDNVFYMYDIQKWSNPWMSLWASTLLSLHIFMMSTYASGSRIYLRWAVIESFKVIWGQFAIPVYGQKICEILFCDLCVERWDKLHQKRSITFLTYDDWRTIQDLKNIVRKVLLVFLLCLSLRYFYVNCSFCLAFNKCNVRLAINESHLHLSKSFLEKKWRNWIEGFWNIRSIEIN